MYTHFCKASRMSSISFIFCTCTFDVYVSEQYLRSTHTVLVIADALLVTHTLASHFNISLYARTKLDHIADVF